ncbi:hypothetical protein [Burkholderia cenocepacia]|uniref:hypothetical protein n=1 Tax=Burkholderia cenocepacia TaxID=95486 RepID=UPI002AB0BF61|nr:hypothetical protein [Burkholderia cenocepacia]
MRDASQSRRHHRDSHPVDGGNPCRRAAPRRTAPRRTAPHRTAPHRTAPHRTVRLSFGGHSLRHELEPPAIRERGVDAYLPILPRLALTVSDGLSTGSRTRREKRTNLRNPAPIRCNGS